MTITPETAPAALQYVERPADAQRVEDWIDQTGTGVWGRFSRGTRRGAASAHDYRYDNARAGYIQRGQLGVGHRTRRTGR
jgi:hypothetical protein